MTKICLIAGNSEEAYRFARLQSLEPSQWFYPKSPDELLFKTNFHVIVVGTAGQNMPSNLFEKIYQLALQRGKIDRR
jgi:hypothetical protein